MENLKSIPGIGESSLELLEAAGFLDVDSVARTDADTLANELKRANSVLRISKKTPSRKMVAAWIIAARGIAGIEEQEEDPVSTEETKVDYEESPEVAAMLEGAPFAIPMPARILMEQQLAVLDIPAAILLNSYSGDFDVRTSQWLPGIRQAKTKPSWASSNNIRLSEGSHRLEIDMKRLRSTSDVIEPLVGLPVVKTSPSNDRMALIRAPRAETNKGRNPKSRRYIHGVLHSRPWSIAAGALVTLLTFVSTPLAVISSLLLLLSREMPQEFGWVPGWFIVFPMSLPFFGLGYLTWGLGGFCRICGQRLFRNGSHRKSPRAHHVRGLGYIIPLCFHILLFRWFRCSHCGTSIRLKE